MQSHNCLERFEQQRSLPIPSGFYQDKFNWFAEPKQINLDDDSMSVTSADLHANSMASPGSDRVGDYEEMKEPDLKFR